MQISYAESRIMEALWTSGPLALDQIVARVAKANRWAPGTVKTLVTRLLRKKAIAGAKDGAHYTYRPLLERSVWVQAESRSLLDKLFKGELAPMVAHFAEHEQLTARDIGQLKELIARIEDKKGKQT